jgi:hypothetical protein
MTFEILPRVVPDIPNIEVSIGKAIVEGYGRNPDRLGKQRKFNLFAHLWANRVSGGAKMSLPEMREYIKKASWYKRGMGAISSMNKTTLQALIDQHEPKNTIVNTSSAKPVISASEAVGHENFNASTPQIEISELETQAEVAIAEHYNNDNTRPPNVILPDTNPLKTEAEEVATTEPALLSTKAEKGHTYKIKKKDLVKWKHPKELGEAENLPVIVEEGDVFNETYDSNKTYYLPPLDPNHPDMIALNDWITRNRDLLKPNADRKGLNEPGKKGKTYSVGNTLQKLSYIPKSFGLIPLGRYDYEATTPEAKAWLDNVKASEAYKNPKPSLSKGAIKIRLKAEKNVAEGKTKTGKPRKATKKKVEEEEDDEEDENAKEEAEQVAMGNPQMSKLRVINEAWKMEQPAYKKSKELDDVKLSKIKGRFKTPKFITDDKTEKLLKEWNLAEELLDRIGNRINPLRYTSYQFNIDYFARRHTDGGNRGLSCIFAVGDFTPEKGSGLLVVNGRPIDIKYQPLLFNGVDNPHMVLQLTEEDKANDRHRCSFVMFETRGQERDEVPDAKNPRGKLSRYIASKGQTKFNDEEKKRLARSTEEMTKGWYPNVETDVLPYMAKKPSRSFGNTMEYADDSDGEVEGISEFKSLPYSSFSGEGRQHNYSVYMRHLDDAGLLPHMFPHMTGGKMEEHGKEGEARLNPPIKVAKGTVFNRKYEEDKLYELPVLSKTDPDVKALTDYMMANELPINKSRVNSGIGRSQTVGRVRQKFKSTFNDSAFTKANPDLKTLLFNIGKKYNPLGFTSVQVNQNYECLPHIDKNNHGLSMIFAVGDYGGGDLYINDKPHNIAYKPLIFNGAKNLHYVSKITSGNRFSFVYFTTGKKKT